MKPRKGILGFLLQWPALTYTENDFDAYFTTHMASGAYLTHHLYGQVGLSGPVTLGTVGFGSAPPRRSTHSLR